MILIDNHHCNSVAGIPTYSYFKSDPHKLSVNTNWLALLQEKQEIRDFDPGINKNFSLELLKYESI